MTTDNDACEVCGTTIPVVVDHETDEVVEYCECTIGTRPGGPDT